MTKSLHRLLIILIFIFVSASAYLFSTQNKQTPVSQISNPTSTPKINLQQEDIKPAVLENKKTNKPIDKKIETPPPTTTPNTKTDEQKPETTPIIIAIEDKEYRIEVKPNSSAYEAMNSLKGSGQISFSSKNFSGLGYFIEEINGIKNSPPTGFYWTLYINNEEAKVGVSGYILKPNDLTTWKYVRK
jgi:hypothetical protein